MVLYKYRSLENLKWLLDILINGRLYGSSFNKLNDPMEGAYRYDSHVPKEKREQLLKERGNTLICSLSKRNDIGLMWTHYANEGRGCCIEVEVTSTKWKEIPVKYTNELPNVNNDIDVILGTKATCWEYEKEVRYIRTEDNIKDISPYLEVRVTKVIFGYGVSTAEYNMYKRLIQGINQIKKKKHQISCEKIRIKDDLIWI